MSGLDPIAAGAAIGALLAAVAAVGVFCRWLRQGGR